MDVVEAVLDAEFFFQWYTPVTLEKRHADDELFLRNTPPPL